MRKPADWCVTDDNGVDYEGSDIDELHVGQWLFMEAMDTNRYFLEIGDAHIHVFVQSDGKASINIIRDAMYPQIEPKTEDGE